LSRRIAGPKSLTRRQRLFVAEYLVDFNATKAATKAGYSSHSACSAGYKALQIPTVRAAIEEQQAERLTRLAMSADEVLVELSLIARANVLDYMRLGRDGEPIADFSGLDRDRAAALSEITVEDFFEGRGENKREVRRIRFKLHDKLGALDRLAKHHGLLKERVALEPSAEEAPPTPKHSNRQVARAILAVLRSAQEEGDDEDEIIDQS
jgi:phage terminase small subunit